MRYVLILFAALAWRTVSAADQAQIALEVENMTCAACPITVKKALSRVDGVSQVTVHYERRTAVVSYDPAKTTPAALTSATANAGFPSAVRD
jgi:periplasmic mercuric ion binding protein